MTKREELEKLADALKFYDYARERDTTKTAGIDYDASLDKLFHQGIGDLDFDPYFFLGTEQTSPEGWAIKK